MHTIRPMTASDIADGMRLKTEAGWNQVDADWRRFLALGSNGCFVAERQGRVVGSVTTCRFETIAWVAMLLVEKVSRGAGIGRSLLTHCLEHLEIAGATSVRLDATSLGRPLYESLGFRVDFHLHRYRGVVTSSGCEHGTREMRPNDMDMIAALDHVATGTDRRALLERLFEENPRQSLISGSFKGPISSFVFWRQGSTADQIGPCIAEPNEGRALFTEVIRRLSGHEVIIDIPSENHHSTASADGFGLTRSREFWRMTRGEPVIEDIDRLWASSGPEMG